MECLGDGADQGAEKDNGDAAAAGDDGTHRGNQIAGDFRGAGRLAKAHDAMVDLLKGTAGIEDLQNQEQKHHIEYQRHHAAHTGDDGATGGEHGGKTDGAQHQIENDARQVAEDQRGHQVPAQTHQNDHNDRQNQKNQSRKRGAVQFNGRGDAGTGAEPHHDEEHGGDGGGNSRIGETGADHLSQIRLLGKGGADGGIGDGSQVVAEDGSADDGTAHQSQIDVQAVGQRQQHRSNGGDGTGRGAAGCGDEDTRQEPDEGDQAGVQIQLGHYPNQCLNEAALPQQLGKDPCENKCHGFCSEHGVLQALEGGRAKGLFILGQKKAHDHCKEGDHGQGGQASGENGVDDHTDEHYDDGNPDAHGTAVKLYFFPFCFHI